jgi:hypothetical protein
MTNTPELDKMVAVKTKSQAIGEFLEWMQYEKHYVICNCDENTTCEYYPIRTSTENLLAEFFEIDLKKAELEKRELLKQIQSNQ